MFRKLILALTLLILFVGVVSAEQVTMTVNSKHVVGVGTGYSPMDYDNFNSVVYVISELKTYTYYSYVSQEYPISHDDYSKVKNGDVVVLESPNSRADYWKVIKIN